MLSRLSLTAKIAVVIVTANLVGLAVTTWLSWSADLATALARAESEWSKATEQVGATAEGAVKWKKASVIQDAYARYRAQPELGLVAFVALNAKMEDADSWSADPAWNKNDFIARVRRLAETAPEAALVDRQVPGEILVVAPLGLDKAGKRIGFVAASWSSTPVVEAVRSDAIFFAGKQALVIALVTVAFLIAMRHFAGKPLGLLAERITAMQQGDLAGSVPLVERSDSIGVIARALDGSIASIKDRIVQEEAARREREEIEDERLRFADQARQSAEVQGRAMAALGRALECLAGGDFSTRLDDIGPQFDKLRADFDQMAVSVADTLSGIAQTAQALDGGALDLAASADQLAKRTEIQAAALEQTAAALEEITGTVAVAADKADLASKLVIATKENAHGSAEVVRQAVAAMDRIQNSSAQIGTIITAIDEIAFQTNLLALNAGVEAARAGEAGKGFAVVAQEVRELAQRSAAAAKEIKQIVSASGEEVGSGVTLVNAMGNSLLSIETQVNDINDSIAAIVSSAREQSTGLAEINNAIREMDQSTQQNAAMVEETNAACQELQSQSNLLKAALGGFRFDGGRTAPPSRSLPAAVEVSSVARAAAPTRAAVQAPPRAGLRMVAGQQRTAAAADWEEF